MLCVGDRIADHVLEEDLEHGASLLVDQTRDALYTATTSQTADGGLGDALHVVARSLSMALGAALAETLAAEHVCRVFFAVFEEMNGLKILKTFKIAVDAL